MSSTAPYLSIVLTARNDNYGGDFNERLQNGVNWLTALVEANKFPVELVILDYNPVPGNEPLIQMIRWPQNRRYLTIRVIHVPNEVHKKLVDPEIRKTVPFFEFNAKNMAIRRAKGEHILSTNADILFHPGFIKYAAEGNLRDDCYYRADRFDYKKIDSYDFNKVSATLKKIQQKVFRLMLKGYAYDVKRGENFFEETAARLENFRHRMVDIHLIKIRTFAHKWTISINHDGFLMKYHTHCAGDFMLMHRDHWFKLRGYPEDTYISTHCDALFTVMARTSGLSESLLRWPIYHQDHERRYNTDFDQVKHDDAINSMFQRLLDETREMEKSHQPKISNAADWGLAGEDFKETIIP